MKFLLTAITCPTGTAINSVRTQECSAPGVVFIPFNPTASPNPSRVNFISEDLGSTAGITVTDAHCLCLYKAKSTQRHWLWIPRSFSWCLSEVLWEVACTLQWWYSQYVSLNKSYSLLCV